MRTYIVTIPMLYYKKEFQPKPIFGVGQQTPAFERRVRAESRQGAVDILLNEILNEVPKMDQTEPRSKFTVQVGTKDNSETPDRMHGFQFQFAEYYERVAERKIID